MRIFDREHNPFAWLYPGNSLHMAMVHVEPDGDCDTRLNELAPVVSVSRTTNGEYALTAVTGLKKYNDFTKMN